MFRKKGLEILGIARGANGANGEIGTKGTIWLFIPAGTMCTPWALSYVAQRASAAAHHHRHQRHQRHHLQRFGLIPATSWTSCSTSPPAARHQLDQLQRIHPASWCSWCSWCSWHHVHTMGTRCSTSPAGTIGPGPASGAADTLPQSFSFVCECSLSDLTKGGGGVPQRHRAQRSGWYPSHRE